MPQWGLLVKVGSNEAEQEAEDAKRRCMLVPDHDVDDDGQDLTNVAEDGEKRRGNKRAREPRVVGHRCA